MIIQMHLLLEKLFMRLIVYKAQARSSSTVARATQPTVQMGAIIELNRFCTLTPRIHFHQYQANLQQMRENSMLDQECILSKPSTVVKYQMEHTGYRGLQILAESIDTNYNQ